VGSLDISAVVEFLPPTADVSSASRRMSLCSTTYLSSCVRSDFALRRKWVLISCSTSAISVRIPGKHSKEARD
jgi:hypothetical protein